MTRVIPVKFGKKFNRRDALSLWHEVTLKSVLQDGPDLSARQIAILTTIYLEQGPHTVRSLAKKLGVTKAVITRAIDALEAMRFVRRCADHRDKRSIIIGRTGPGANYLSQFAESIRGHLINGSEVA